MIQWICLTNEMKIAHIFTRKKRQPNKNQTNLNWLCPSLVLLYLFGIIPGKLLEDVLINNITVIKSIISIIIII